jgi:hypothetical protein
VVVLAEESGVSLDMGQRRSAEESLDHPEDLDLDLCQGQVIVLAEAVVAGSLSKWSVFRCQRASIIQLCW